MNRLPSSVLHILALLPALAALAVLNVDWTQQGHVHAGAFGVFHHQHGHTGEHRHGDGDRHSHSASAPDHEHPESPGSQDQGSEPTELFLASSLLLDSDVPASALLGTPLPRVDWTQPTVEDSPPPTPHHNPAAPRGPPTSV